MAKKSGEIMRKAFESGIVIPAFNIPYIPMMAPVVRALQDTNCFGLIAVARPDWAKFGAGSPKAVRDEYERTKDERVTRLHLDHVPVIDEENKTIDYEAIIADAIALGYESVMVDGSRLSLDDNIAATGKIVDIAHQSGTPVEAELGAVLGHEAGPLPPYEELFASGKGFTDPAEAQRFVQETKVDWLSVAIGNIHGAISGAAKDEKKVNARLNIEHLGKIKDVTGVPIVLHGGSGIQKASIMAGVRSGVAKINIGTTIRQAYEAFADDSAEKAAQAVYDATVTLVNDEFEIAGSAAKLS